jgi:hypothetical protein
MSLRGSVPGLPDIGRTPGDRTVPGVLSILYYPIPSLGVMVPGFAVNAYRPQPGRPDLEPGVGRYYSRYTIGTVLAQLEPTMRTWLGPVRATPASPGMIPPPTRLSGFRPFCGWVVGNCIGDVIFRCATIKTYDVWARPLTPAVVYDHDEEMIRRFASVPGCEFRSPSLNISLSMAEKYLEVHWYADLRLVMEAYNKKLRLLNPVEEPEEHELRVQVQQQAVHGSVMRILVQRARDGRQAVPQDPEWQKRIAVFDRLFRTGRGRPPGPSKPRARPRRRIEPA